MWEQNSPTVPPICRKRNTGSTSVVKSEEGAKNRSTGAELLSSGSGNRSKVIVSYNQSPFRERKHEQIMNFLEAAPLLMEAG